MLLQKYENRIKNIVQLVVDSIQSLSTFVHQLKELTRFRGDNGAAKVINVFPDRFNIFYSLSQTLKRASRSMIIGINKRDPRNLGRRSLFGLQ